jgi:hypothetical protein
LSEDQKLSYNEVLVKIKTEEVKASELLYAAHNFAVDGCTDDQWLKVRGSNSTLCIDKLNTFKDTCANRIFPDLNKTYKAYNTANRLLKRYSSCTGV